VAGRKIKNRVVQWWNEKDPSQLASDIFDTVCYIDQEQQVDRREKNLRCARLYGNMDLAGLGPYSYARTETPNLPENRVKYNVISSSADTLCAKISKMKPRVSFLTHGGRFSLQEQSQKLTKYIVGLFKRNHVYDLHQLMFRDELIFDLAALKHYRDGNRIITERVLSPEIYVDVADALYGKPTHMYHVKFVHKEVLTAAYPDSHAAIMESAADLAVGNLSAPMSSEEREYVIVIEAWKLPTKEGAKDGRHVISVEKGVLHDEKYTRDYFPFTFGTWSRPVVGFYGQALADRLSGNQVEINKMLRIIQRSFHLGSAFKVFLEYGSRVAREQINNDIGSIVYFSGSAPQFYTPQTVHPEFFRHLEWLIKSSYEEAGISQLSATSRMPAGIDGGSGKAIREYNDLETERFAIAAQQYEASFLETARQYIDLSIEIKEDGLDLDVVADSKRFVETIKWSEIDLGRDDYVMQMFPTSMLPNDPAGQLATVQEWVNAGWVDKDWGMRLLDFPDLDGYISLESAALDDLLYTLDQMIYKGLAQTPEPFQDLKRGVTIFQSGYLWAKRNEVPEERLELIRNWITRAQTMLGVSESAVSAAKNAMPLIDPTQLGGAPISVGQPPMLPPGAPQVQAGAAPQVA
jgi:hypothetical protein